MAFSPDTRWVIAFGIRDGRDTVDVVEVGSWRVVPALTHERPGAKSPDSGEERSITRISFSPDSDQLLTLTGPYCDEGELVPGIAYIWRITSGDRVTSVPLTFECAGAPGRQTPTRENELFKDWADWSDVSFQPSLAPVFGGTIDRAAAPDGGFAASEGSRVAGRWLEEKGLTDMALAQGGRWLVTTGSRGNARVWALTREGIIAESCSRLRRVGYSGQDDSGVEFTNREDLLRDACPEMRQITYITR